MRILRVFFSALLVLCCYVSAQTIRASIYGRVLDPTGSGIPGATVLAVHTTTGTAYSFTTDTNGDLTFRDFSTLVSTAWKWRPRASLNLFEKELP